WLRALGCDPGAAEEHCQDALLAGWQHGLASRSFVDASRWLRTAARNLWWMELRAQRRRPPAVPWEGNEGRGSPLRRLVAEPRHTLSAPRGVSVRRRGDTARPGDPPPALPSPRAQARDHGSRL